MDSSEKKQLVTRINSNKHQVFVLSFEEFENSIKHSKTSLKQRAKQTWDKYQKGTKVTAENTSNASSVLLLTRVLSDLGVTANKAYIKYYGGKPHIIFKGFAGQRNIFTGVKYSATNPKIVQMGIGKIGATNVAKQGGVLSIVIMSGYRITDYVLRDSATLSQLIGGLATDIAKIGVSTGAAILAAKGAGVLFGSAVIGPLVAVVVVGFAISEVLNILDEKYRITEKVIQLVEEAELNLKESIEHGKRELNEKVVDATEYVVTQTIKYGMRMGLRWLQGTVDRAIPRGAGW